jgi:hypothetical protein
MALANGVLDAAVPDKRERALARGRHRGGPAVRAGLFHQIAFRNRNREQITAIYIYRYISSRYRTIETRKKGRVLQKTAMRSDDYRRLRETFVEMALQGPDSPERTRWLAIAQACLELERQPPVGHTAPAGPAFTSPTNGGTSEAPAPRRPAGQDRRPYGTAPPRSNVPNSTAASIYRKLGALLMPAGRKPS